MPPQILGLHHVTATVNDAQADLDFCLETLGLRLVKKTVNFDNHHVYHFYYGDERGTPGTIWTTFPYRGHGVPTGTKGAGQITATSFSVPAGSLPAWSEKLTSGGLHPADDEPRFGQPSLSVLDPSGLIIDLVEAADDRAALDRSRGARWSGDPRPSQRHVDHRLRRAEHRVPRTPPRRQRRRRARVRARGWPSAAIAPAGGSRSCISPTRRAPATDSAPCTTWRWRSPPPRSSWRCARRCWSLASG